MNRGELIRKMYNKPKHIGFDFDTLWHPPMSNYITNQDIAYINNIVLDAKLNSRPKEKYAIMDQIMKYRGFTRLHAGTNRLVYKSEYDSTIVLKIGLDRIGISDNPKEYVNQLYLKPFCCKIFEVSPCGTVAMVERVNAIRNRNQFEEIASTVFDIVMTKFSGLVLEDIGSNFFMNWGMRNGFGPVILDYPYAYLIDEEKLVCHRKDQFGIECLGLVDYDEGLNTLVCEKCGIRYTAKSLSKNNGYLSIDKFIDNEKRKEKAKMIEKFKVQITYEGKKNSYEFGGDTDTTSISTDNIHVFYDNKEEQINNKSSKKKATPPLQSTFIRKSATAEDIVGKVNIEEKKKDDEIAEIAKEETGDGTIMLNEEKENILEYFRTDISTRFVEETDYGKSENCKKSIFSKKDADSLIDFAVSEIMKKEHWSRFKEEEIRSIILMKVYSDESYNITDDPQEEEDYIDPEEEERKYFKKSSSGKKDKKMKKRMLNDF